MTTTVWRLPPAQGGHLVEMEHRWLTGALTLRCDGRVIHTEPGGLAQSARMSLRHPFPLGEHQALFEMFAIGRVQDFRLYVDGKLVPAQSETREVLHRVIIALLGLVLGIVLVGLLSGRTPG